MANQPNEDFSESELKGANPEMSPALAWAANRFEFDPGLLEPQPGVETLQKWLLNQDATVALDAMLGPQTLTALERAFAADEGSAVVKDQLGIKDEDTSAQDTARPDPTPATDGEPASARPVALSDAAISDISQDRLGFTPYVEAVAEFILAEQTRPPLAIAIDARWGQGKTSFMNMIDAQLERASEGTAVRVATTWFNPWKYCEPEQVWAAFVANIARALRAKLTWRQRLGFHVGRARHKLKSRADVALLLRGLVAIAFLVLLGSLAFIDWSKLQPVLAAEYKLLNAFTVAAAELQGGYFLYVPLALALLLAVIYVYVTFTKNLGLNLLEYIEKTDFKDKIGTLSQFENEMKRLSASVPENLKVVVFIDDLDRCKGPVLGEIIEALQLADVSRSCIFVLGMDMQIVANVIETERPELALSVDSSATGMEHGSGYKFLEKVIQARLTLPHYNMAQMQALVASTMGRTEAAAGAPPDKGPGAPEDAPGSDAGGIVQGTLKAVGDAVRVLAGSERKTPSDSEEVIAAAEHYGSRHFANPRRLKRFINGFRLQTYLAAAVQSEATQVDHLARFLVLAEKWPALLHHLVEENKGAEILHEAGPDSTARTMAMQIKELREDDRFRVIELLTGRSGYDAMLAAELQSLAAWTGFSYYPGLKK